MGPLKLVTLRGKIGSLAISIIAKLFHLGEISFQSKYYINAKPTIKASRSAGLTICEYTEKLWNEEGITDATIAELQQSGALRHTDDVCEIGPGTGRYLERVISIVQPKRYHIYETADDWAQYLKQTYAIVVNNHANGHSLKYTASDSCGLVLAFGVFVYLDIVNSFEYFEEMIRVCSDGYIVFDCFLADSWNESVVGKWMKCGQRYPVILPDRVVVDFFQKRGYAPQHSFRSKYGCDYSDYLVFKKQHGIQLTSFQ